MIPRNSPQHWELINGTVLHLRNPPHYVYPRNLPLPRRRPLFRYVETITLIQGGTVCSICLYFAMGELCTPYYAGRMAWTL